MMRRSSLRCDAHQLDDTRELAQTFEREILGLHRNHDQPLRGGERVERQQASEGGQSMMTSSYDWRARCGNALLRRCSRESAETSSISAPARFSVAGTRRKFSTPDSMVASLRLALLSNTS